MASLTDEFSVVKSRLLRNLKKRLLDPTGAARFLIALRSGGLDLGYVTGLAPAVETLTREDLNAYIAERLPPLDEMLTVIVTPNAEGIVADCVVTSPAVRRRLHGEVTALLGERSSRHRQSTHRSPESPYSPRQAATT